MPPSCPPPIPALPPPPPRQVMSFSYLQKRAELIAVACSMGAQLALPGARRRRRPPLPHVFFCDQNAFFKCPPCPTTLPASTPSHTCARLPALHPCCTADETVYDAVLLLDRAMSIPLKVADGLLGVTMAACLVVAAEQAGLPDAHLPALVSWAGAWGDAPGTAGGGQVVGAGSRGWLAGWQAESRPHSPAAHPPAKHAPMPGTRVAGPLCLCTGGCGAGDRRPARAAGADAGERAGGPRQRHSLHLRWAVVVVVVCVRLCVHAGGCGCGWGGRRGE